MDTNIISLIISIIMMIVGLSTFIISQVRNSKKDVELSEQKLNSIREDTMAVRVTLKVVSDNVAETKTDVKSLSTNLTEIDKRLTKVEENLKTAFKRIDELRDK